MDRFLENKVSYGIYPDTQILLGRNNGKPNLSLEATQQMEDCARIHDRFVYLFGVGSLFWLVLNMILMPLNWDAVFVNKEITTGVEVFVLLGFLSILLFDLLVVPWVCLRRYHHKSVSGLDSYLLIGSIACLFVLVTAKVMTDEVGRESRFGLGCCGEFAILNALLLIQIAYNVYFLFAYKKRPRIHNERTT